MWLAGPPPRVGALALAVAAPLALGLLRHPDVLFVPMIALFPVLAWLGIDRRAPPAYVALFVGCLWLLALPGLLAAAGPRHYAFYYTLSVVLFLWLFPIAARHVTWKAGFGTILIVLVPIAIACADYAHEAGIIPRRATYFAIYQTHLDEAIGYISEFVHPLTIGAVLVLPILLAVLVAKAGSPRPRLPWRLQPLALGLAGVVLWQTHDASNEIRMVSSLATYRQTLQGYREVAALRKTRWHEIQARQTRPEAELHVIVIGESTNRNHMGLYGYFRDTTPRLSSMADDLVVLTDVISSHSHTMRALPEALTLADVDNAMDYADERAHSIIEILKAAGVTTWWLSNQKPMGIWDDHVAVLAGAADHVEFLSKRLDRGSTAGLDERLLPAFRGAIRDSAASTVVFVHLMGTHWPYRQRYPKRSAHFAGPLTRAMVGDLKLSEDIITDVNSYDNAVMYDDHVISEMIDILRKKGPPASTLLYFSDHGESVLDGTGHDAARFGRGHVEIPLLFWFSDTFKDRHPDLVRTLVSNRDERFMTDELEDAVLDLAGIETDALEPAHSPFRTEFDVPARRAIGGQIDYDSYHDALLNMKRNLQKLREHQSELYGKLWAHRVDSLGKLSEAVGNFAGVELDLVFNAEHERFEVRHPPVADTGLRLTDVLAYLRRQAAGIRLWLDMKNVDQDNVERIVDRLIELDRTFDLKDRAIVETSFAGAGLKRLSAAGFYVSYYLPTRPIRKALKAEQIGELRMAAERIARVVERHDAKAVSFGISSYPFVRDYLGKLADERGLDFLTWDPSLDSSQASFGRRLARLDSDHRLKVILVSFRSRFDI